MTIDWRRYGLGPEHIFFESLNKTLAPNPAYPYTPTARAANRTFEDTGGKGRGGGLADLGFGSQATPDESAVETDKFSDVARGLAIGLGVVTGNPLTAFVDFPQMVTRNEMPMSLTDLARSVTGPDLTGFPESHPDLASLGPDISDPRGGMASDAAPDQGGQIGGGQDVGDPGTFEKGGMVRGAGGGMDDSIMALIDGMEPARISSDEFVIPSDVVSALGDGSSTEGGRKLYDLIAKVRRKKFGKNKQPPKLKEGLESMLEMVREHSKS